MPDHLFSFEAFRDEPGSPFYCAAGKTPEETWAEIVRCQTEALAEIVSATHDGPLPLEPLLIGGWHHRIFRTTFPRDAGRVRSKDPNGDWEEVYFGVKVGTSNTARVRTVKGAHPNRIFENLSRATVEFNDVTRAYLAGDVEVTLRTSTIACGRLYTKICLVHPFVDGNLRAAYSALQAGLRCLRLPMVEFPDPEEHDSALDTALRTDSRQSYGPLGSLIEGIIRSAA